MIWVTWRQHRVELLAAGGLLVLLLLILLLTGTRIASIVQSSGFSACLPHPASSSCVFSPPQNTVEIFVQEQAFGNNAFYTVFQFSLLALPVLAGMFIGAQVVARELEVGTSRLAWTQSVSRSRWFLSKTALLAGSLLAASALLYVALSWWRVPVVDAGSYLWAYDSYDAWGFVSIAYMAFALMLGLCAGAVLRKTVSAMAVTLVVFLVIRIVIAVFWRSYFLPPVTAQVSLANSGAVASPFQSLEFSATEELVDSHGHVVQSLPATVKAACIAKSAPTAPLNAYNQCLAAHGYHNAFVYVYQPADRFWLFQAIESGIYLLLAIVLFGFALWWVRYRLT